MKIQHLEITAAYASLNSDLAGLDESEAKRRLAEFGPNQVEEIAGEPLILTFAREFGHFFAIILWIAAGLAFFAEWKQPGQGMATLVSGESKALVFATGIHSAFGQIAHLTQTAADTISPLQTEIIRHLPALGLGAEKPGPDIMKAPPRRRDQRLLGGALLARA